LKYKEIRSFPLIEMGVKVDLQTERRSMADNNAEWLAGEEM
jgi:hypothetical protein